MLPECRLYVQLLWSMPFSPNAALNDVNPELSFMHLSQQFSEEGCGRIQCYFRNPIGLISIFS
jgi:hypothetical protein